MRSYDPEDSDDILEAKRMRAQPWMLEQLALNPAYPHWGPGEDYMPGADGADHEYGWRSAIVHETWISGKYTQDPRFPEDPPQQFPVKLDDLNEVVHFYFYVERDGEECDACEQSGYNPKTSRIADDFYDLTETGRRWSDKVTQDEVDALVEADRLRRWDKKTKSWVKVPRTAAEVNAANTKGAPFFGGEGSDGLHSHDAINRFILVEARAKRLGIWGLCPRCEGHGSVYTAPEARLGVVLWVLHPRKGAARGVDVKNIARKQLPEVYAFLREAAKRNAERFSRIPGDR